MIIIVSDSCGQMGNKIYNQVNAISMGLENNIPVCYYDFDEFASFAYLSDSVQQILRKKKKTFFQKIIFKVISFINKNWSTNLKSFISIKNQYTCDKIFELVSLEELLHKNYYFEGWPFVNLSALRNQISEIRNYYSPTLAMGNFLDNKLQRYANSDFNLIGVHIRRGDYKNWRGGAYYYSDEVYLTKIKELSNCLDNKRNVFFIFSNEKVCEETFYDDSYEIVFPHGSGEEDFHLLCRMDYIISPPSSYSGIASLLGNVPRYIIQNSEDTLNLDKMKVWLIETDNDGNAIN